MQIDLFVVSPHSKNSNNFLLFEYFVDHSVLNIDSSRVAAFEVADERFISWRILEGVIFEDVENFLSFIF